MENPKSDDILISLLWVEDEAVARELLGKVRMHTKKDQSKSRMIVPDSLYEKIKDKIVAEKLKR